MFKGLPAVFVSCQPAADAVSDKIKAMLEFGMDSTRVKDLWDICHRIRKETFDMEAVARSLAMSGTKTESLPLYVMPTYAERHQPTWEFWLAKAGGKDSRALADVCAEVRQPVEEVVRRAARL